MFKNLIKNKCHTRKLSSKISTNGNNSEYNLTNWIQSGNIRHYPPAVREWNNSVYSFNKANDNESLVKYNTLDKLIKSYLNIGNDINLARSKRMRYLRRKSTSKKLFVSSPEIRQTNDNINITVYYFDKLKHNYIRKLFFFNKPRIASKINSLKLNKKYNKVLFRKKLKYLEKRVPLSGIKYIKEVKLFNNKVNYKNKYIEQNMLLYFYTYILSILNISVYNPINLYLSNKSNVKNVLRKESIKVDNMISKNPDSIILIDYGNCALENIEKHNINKEYLTSKLLNIINNEKLKLTDKKKIAFVVEINKKLYSVTKNFINKNVFSSHIVLKILNYLSLKINKFVSKQIFKRRTKKVSKMMSMYNNDIIRMKRLLPSLKTLIDNLYNKKTELNLVNLKYFHLSSDVFTQVVTTKLRKRLTPVRVLNKSMDKVKVFLFNDVRKKLMLNNMHKLHNYNNLSLTNIPVDISSKEGQDDMIQNVFNQLFPYNFMYKYFNVNTKYDKIASILNDTKYKKMLGIRVEAKGRLTRRNTAARSASHLMYKGNLKDMNKYWDMKEDLVKNIPTVLLRNSGRANTQHTFGSSRKRIGAFGIKTWISAK